MIKDFRVGLLGGLMSWLLLGIVSLAARANDDCLNALSVEVPSLTLGTTDLASIDDNVPGCNDELVAPGVWYVVEGTGNEITASLCDAPFDSRISVYGGSCGELICIGSNDDSCSRGSQITWCSESRQSYWILVHGSNDASGSFALQLTGGASCTPHPQDLCQNALEIGTGDVSFSTLGAVNDGPPIFSLGSDVWFTHRASFSGTLTITTCDQADFDTAVAVYSIEAGCPPPKSALVACNDDGGFCGTTSRVSFAATAGATYLIQVGGIHNAQGSGLLSVTTTANDDCSTPLSVTEGEFAFDSSSAAADGETPCFGSAAADLWYSYTPKCSGELNVRACASGASQELILTVYDGNRGCPPDPKLALGCAIGDCGPDGAQVTTTVKAGEPYLVQIARAEEPGTVGVLALELSAFTAAPCLILENCGFEDGNFDRWEIQDLSDPLFPLQVSGAGAELGFGFFTSDPSDGCFSVVHGFDGDGPGTISIGQDVDLPAAAQTLTFRYRGAWDLTFGAVIDRSLAVIVEPRGGGEPLGVFPILTAVAGETNTDTGALNGQVDLAPFAGEGVRLRFSWNVPESYTGPGFFELDNVTTQPSCAPVTRLTCSSAENNVVLTWGNPVAYSEVRVYRDGAEVVQLPGDVSSWIDPNLPSGDYVYEVEGLCDGERLSPPEICQVPHVATCDSPSALKCFSIGSAIGLTWQNNGNYESIRVFRNAQEIAHLGATSTSFTDKNVSPAQYAYRVEGDCGDIGTASSPPCVIVQPRRFVRGDVNGNNVLDGLVDGLFLLEYQFQQGVEPPCLEAADVNGDGILNGLNDSTYLLLFQFQSGPPPPAPHPDCGPDPDPESGLGCHSTPPCA